MSIVLGDNFSNTITTSAEDDSVFGFEGNDFISSGDGNDGVFGGGGNDIIRSGNGDDVLIGGAGNDILDGGAGDDNLFGGAGTDILEGGEGADTFIFDLDDGPAIDIITDFTSGEDTIFIQSTGVGSSAPSSSAVTYDATTGLVSVNGQAFIQLDPGLDIDVDNDFFLA